VIRRPEINYVSVKLSSIVSQIITIDRDGSLDRVAAKMRLLYREAESHGPSSTSTWRSTVILNSR